MDIRRLTDMIAASPQIETENLEALAALGYKSIMSNRPDGEEPGQPSAEAVRTAAEAAGLAFAHIPVVGGGISDADIEAFGKTLTELPQPILGFCRTGMRTTTLWALSQAATLGVAPVLSRASQAGYDLSALRSRLEGSVQARAMKKPLLTCEVLIVGAGSAGIATAASLLKRRPGLDILIVDPSDRHAYQPGWTMVGGGIFKPEDTVRPMRAIMPDGVRWEKVAVAVFAPEKSTVSLADGRTVRYRMMVAAPGIKLNWGAIEGLEDSLGRNGVTSNYRFDTAPYTWNLVQNLKGGRALFTQPPMPIKCAGAPQKALYLSGDHWFRKGRINDINIEFHNAGPVLFGVKEYVPALMEYMTKYRADLNFGSRLVSVDGASKTATFARTATDGTVTEDKRGFDMIHVCPPQMRLTSSAKARLPRPMAGSRWTRRRSSTSALKTSSRSAMPPRPRMPRQLPRRASRHRWWQRIFWRSWTARRCLASTTVMVPARSPLNAARSCWPNSDMAGDSFRPSRPG